MSFAPQNDFERSLMQAANDPAHRPQFYRDLLRADIFVIQNGKQLPNQYEKITLTEKTSFQIASIEFNGKPYIPIFSSLPRLQATLSSDAAFLAVNALELMKLLPGVDLLLNPGSEIGKEFTAQEITAIVNGTIGQPDERHVLETGTRVTIGQPKNEPAELVGALSRFFRSRKQVKRAWLAHYFNPDDGLPPHTLVAVDVTNGLEDLAHEVAIIVKNVSIPDPPVDFIEVVGNEDVARYFLKESKPFYRRRLLGLF
jgi:hypothetical protein